MDKLAENEAQAGAFKFRLPEQRRGPSLPPTVIALGGLHPDPSSCCNEIETFVPDHPFGTDYCTLAPGHDGRHLWPWYEAWKNGELDF